MRTITTARDMAIYLFFKLEFCVNLKGMIYNTERNLIFNHKGEIRKTSRDRGSEKPKERGQHLG